jgi:hypothetical protein
VFPSPLDITRNIRQVPQKELRQRLLEVIAEMTIRMNFSYLLSDGR